MYKVNRKKFTQIQLQQYTTEVNMTITDHKITTNCGK